ncbi:MAG: hypothetical protein U1E78_12115 [Gammaproteobacteria bacterium]
MLSIATINVLRKLERERRRVSRIFYPFPAFLLPLSPAILTFLAIYIVFSSYMTQISLSFAVIVQWIVFRTIEALNLFALPRKAIKAIVNFNAYIWHADPTFKLNCSFSEFNRLMIALNPYPNLFRVDGRIEEFLKSLDTQDQCILVNLGADINDFPSINENLMTAKLGFDSLSLQWLSAKAAVKSELTLNEDNSNIYTRTIVHAADMFYQKTSQLKQNDRQATLKNSAVKSIRRNTLN